MNTQTDRQKPRIVGVKDMLQHVEDEMKKDEQEIAKRGLVWIDEDKQEYVFSVFGRTTYEVAFDEVKTIADLGFVNWHLMGKRWYSAQQMFDFHTLVYNRQHRLTNDRLDKLGNAHS